MCGLSLSKLPEEHQLFFWSHADGVVAITFKRPVASDNYVEMLGDGDANTHSKLLKVDPYDGQPLEKLECVNQVTKRMGTALRNIVEKKAQKDPISGQVKLTEIRIKELTNYYGKAIKDISGDLDAMRFTVWVCLLHTVSSVEKHDHDCCQKGSSSLCFYQRALADNIQSMKHRQVLPCHVATALSSQPVRDSETLSSLGDA